MDDGNSGQRSQRDKSSEHVHGINSSSGLPIIPDCDDSNRRPGYPDECHAVSFDVERLTLKSPLETVNPVARGGLSGDWSTILALGETSRGLDQRATGGVKSFDVE